MRDDRDDQRDDRMDEDPLVMMIHLRMKMT